MNTFEKCKAIRDMLVTRAAEGMVYKVWKDTFVAQQLQNFPDDLKKMKEGSTFFKIQPSDLTQVEMVELGFKKWSESTQMMLIPLWLLPFLADTIEIENLDGKAELIKRDDMDSDHRFGCLAYGVIPRV